MPEFYNIIASQIANVLELLVNLKLWLTYHYA